MHPIASDVFDTTGAFFNAGRWHSPGSRVVYAAEHVSLAALETLIHAGGRKIPPRSITRIEIPEGASIEKAPWVEMSLRDSRDFGGLWLEEMRTAVLQVPSIAVNRMESNYLLNPAHQDFARIRSAKPETFVFDLRFFGVAAIS